MVYILLPVTRDWVLRLQSVVQVEILVVEVLRLRIADRLAEKGFRCGVDGRVIGGGGPLDSDVEPCRTLRC